MRILVGVLGMGIVLVLHAAGCRKPPPPPPPPVADDDSAVLAVSSNAADRYKLLWRSWPADWADKSAFVVFNSAVPRIDVSPESRGKAPTWKELSELLVAHQKQINDILGAAAQKTCDFKLSSDVEATPATEVVMRKMLLLGAVLRADASRQWQAGNMDACVDRLAAMYGLIDHAAQQQDMVVTFRATRLLLLTGETVKAFIEQSPAGAFTTEHGRKIQRAMSRLKKDDPVRLKFAMMGERALPPGITDEAIERVRGQIEARWRESCELVAKHSQ
jgi:hypothetical protein